MIVLFEGFHYPTDAVRRVLSGKYLEELTGHNRCRITHVGYVYEAPATEPVLLLPKVFVNKQGKVFGDYDPVQFILLASGEWERLRKQPDKAQFLFQFSVWLFRAIRQFRQRHPESVLPESANLLDVSDTGTSALSELEIVQALVRFHRDNNSLLTHIKRVNSAQRHTVSWSRTVARQQPILQNGQPVYVQPLVKQKHINYDEELIVLYLSTLAHIQQQYGFRLDLNPLYTRLSKQEFARFQERATRRLKEIRGKYFTDKLLNVWKLLYGYYDKQESMRTQRTFREVLVARDFNVVFEDMIDYLLADPKATLPNALKDQPDGKRVDHIYAYRDLIKPDIDQIYHIGDSKYYGAGSAIGSESVFKQFTYARNVIQQNIDLLNDNRLDRPLHYRDDLTEGYNPTPNFFISAFVGESLDFGNANLTSRDDTDYDRNQHFSGRLFDRDTLILQAYNINFLYVLNAYVSSSATDRQQFRATTRQRFRNELVNWLNSHYTFWQVTPTKESLEAFVTRNFRQLIGRMYRPSDFKDSILVANPKENPLIISNLFDDSATTESYSIQPDQPSIL